MACYPLRFTFTSNRDTFTCIGRNLSSGGNEVFFFWWRRFCPEVGEDGKCHSSQKSIFYNKLQTRSVIWLYQAIYIKIKLKFGEIPNFPISPEENIFENFWLKFAKETHNGELTFYEAVNYYDLASLCKTIETLIDVFSLDINDLVFPTFSLKLRHWIKESILSIPESIGLSFTECVKIQLVKQSYVNYQI